MSRVLTRDGPARRGTRPVSPRLETRARARALQALYAWDVRRTVRASAGAADRRGAAEADDARLPRVAAQVWEDLAVEPAERRLAARLVSSVAEHRSALDHDLSEVATNWRLERMGVVERCVLRLAAAELLQGETPPRVAIHEAVRLAERFGSSHSAQFVNGVLDALARRLGRL